MQIKKRSSEEGSNLVSQSFVKKYFDPNKQKAVKLPQYEACNEHSYSNSSLVEKRYYSLNVKQDLKNKLEKNKLRTSSC